jgi:hypothetical protein
MSTRASILFVAICSGLIYGFDLLLFSPYFFPSDPTFIYKRLSPMEEQGAASELAPVVSTRTLPVYHIDLDLYLPPSSAHHFFAFFNINMRALI